MRKTLSSIVTAVAALALLSTPAMAAELPWHPQYSTTTNNLKGIHFASDACHAWAVGEPPSPGPFTAGGNGTSNGPTPILYTKDAGVHWKAQNSGIRDTTLNRVDFVDLNNGWAVGEPQDTVVTSASIGGTVLHTTNGGKKWVNQSANLPENTGDFEGLSFVNKHRGWIASSGGSTMGAIYFTNDAGATWTSQLLPVGHGSIADVYFVDAWNGWAVDDNHNVLHTTNGGAAGTGGWAVQATLPVIASMEAIDFYNLRRGVIVGDAGQIWYTRNGGTTWKPSIITNNAGGQFDSRTFSDVSFGSSKLVGVSAETDGNEGTPSHVLISHDGGKTFKALSSHSAYDLNSISYARNTDDALAAGKSGAIVTNEGDPTGDCR